MARLATGLERAVGHGLGFMIAVSILVCLAILVVFTIIAVLLTIASWLV